MCAVIYAIRYRAECQRTHTCGAVLEDKACQSLRVACRFHVFNQEPLLFADK